uniref:DHR-2_Lobe_A domain-containing protein n=1 Tax=Macrostomum lignano TaxID=282301 RepID=A0A1I8F5W2_9PLAT
VACASFEIRGSPSQTATIERPSSLLMQPRRSASVKPELEEKFLGSSGDLPMPPCRSEQQPRRRRRRLPSRLRERPGSAAPQQCPLAMAGQQSAAASANSSSSNRAATRCLLGKRKPAATIAAPISARRYFWPVTWAYILRCVSLRCLSLSQMLNALHSVFRQSARGSFLMKYRRQLFEARRPTVHLPALLSYTDRDEAVCETSAAKCRTVVLNLHTIPHLTHKHYAEAGMCLLHSVSLVVEYLHMMDPVQYMPVGCAAFPQSVRMFWQESAVSDDVISPEEDGVCCSNWFLETRPVRVHRAALHACCRCTGHNKGLPPTGAVYAKMRDSCDNIAFNESSGYGEEFVYKEPPLTKLPEISHRLERFYGDRFGPDNLVIVKDSNAVWSANGCRPEQGLIQIPMSSPTWNPTSFARASVAIRAQQRIATFVCLLVLARHGRRRPTAICKISGQRKNRAYNQSQLPLHHRHGWQVIHTKSFNLTPIEVAIEDLEKKNAELTRAFGV